jgi:ATP-dependent helicase/nuclease subunit A
LRIAAIQQVLIEDGDDELIALLDYLQHGTAPRSVTEYLDGLVGTLYDAYRRAPERAAWSRLVAPPALDDAEVAAAIAHLGSMESHGANKSQCTAIAKDAAKAVARDWEGLMDSGLAPRIAAGDYTYYKAAIPDAVIAAYEPLIAQASAVALGKIAGQTLATFELLQRYDRHYTTVRRRQGMLLYADAPLALSGFLPGRSGDEIAHRLDMRIDHLLLDEFQDTDPMQWAILKPFVDRIAAGHDSSLFCVGDVKQAIYGWRGGSAEIFNQLGKDLADLTWQDTDTSYRSARIVLDVVNAVFLSLGENAALDKHRETAAIWASGFREHTRAANARPLTQPGYVEMMETPVGIEETEESGEDGEALGATGHLEFAAERIAALARANPAASIGVLTRKNDTVRRLIFALQRRGVAASAEGGSPVCDDAGVEVILSALTVADHPGDTAAACHVLHSPLSQIVGLTGQQAQHISTVALAIRWQLLDEGYADVVARWARDLAPHCDARGARRLAQLVDIADAYEPLATLRPADFVRHVRNTPVEEPLPARVRVMTVHKSKGLEFDIVALPELHSRFPERVPDLIVDRPTPTGPIQAVYRFADAATRKLAPQLEEAYQRQLAEEIKGALCLLYVAMTRARHALHLFVPPLKMKKDGTPASAGLSHAAILRAALCDGDATEAKGGGRVIFARGTSPQPSPFSQETSAIGTSL